MIPRKTVQEFIDEAIKVHGNLYDYSKVTSYNNNQTKECIICKEHGEFFQSYAKHVYRKFGCPKCKGKKNGNRCRLDNETIIQRFKEVHGELYDYSLVNHNNFETKVIIVCKEHGAFKQLPNNHLAGNGCPMCTNYRFSKPMKEIYDYLKIKEVPFETEKVFEGCRNKLPLPFDFYLPNRNLCIEYDGEYHYKDRVGHDSLKDVQRRDEIKNKYCKERGIHLIRIPYWDKKQLCQIIDTILLQTQVYSLNE